MNLTTERPPVLRIHTDELIIDNFAGGGGASLGIEMALGRSPDIAVNHDARAVAMHKANHPNTRHLIGDVWDVDPVAVCDGRPVGLAWFSPDCTHHSKAKGGKPRTKGPAEKSRGLAWVVIRWAKLPEPTRPRVIMLENVEEFEDWGPLLEDGRPDKTRKGLTFRRWLGTLKKAGYNVELRQLRACDFGAPTSRKRLFIIARRDGAPIVWPKPSHGKGQPLPFRTAADCIDWTHRCPSIFERPKPLADKTLRRIARGIMRYVVEASTPFIVPITHTGGDRVHSINEPLRTITCASRGELALVAPTLIQTGYGEREGQAPRSLDIEKPLGTIVGGGAKHALVSALLLKHYGGVVGQQVGLPLGAITTQDHHSVATAHLIKFRGECHSADCNDPVPTITAGGWHLGEVRAFLVKYYGQGVGQQIDIPLGTVTTKERFGLVTVLGEPYAIADIGMRMFQPRELFTAQGFPSSYIIDPIFEGKPLTKTAQIKCCGNSVSPENARAIVEANFPAREVQAA